MIAAFREMNSWLSRSLSYPAQGCVSSTCAVRRGDIIGSFTIDDASILLLLRDEFRSARSTALCSFLPIDFSREEGFCFCGDTVMVAKVLIGSATLLVVLGF